MKRSRRAPRRCYSLRWHGGRIIVYRATLEAVRASWRRGEVDIEAMDEAAEEALVWLAAVELAEAVDIATNRLLAGVK